MDKQKRRGFTLVEIITVLVILGILCAILIPSLSGWINRANENAAIAEASACLTAVRSIALERYAVNRTYTLADDKAETLTLAELPVTVDIREVTLSGGAQVSKMVFISSKFYIVTYENSVFTVSSKTSSLGAQSDMKAVIKALKDANATTIDSNAAKYSGSKAASVIASLTESGLNLSDMGATSWRYINTGTKNMFYWTDADISSLAGSTIAVMKYNASSGNYTVWTMNVTTAYYNNVVSEANMYVTLGAEKSLIGPLNQSDQSYENALELFREYS